MDRVPLFVFAAVVAVIGVLAASSVYVTERNDATMRAIGPMDRVPLFVFAAVVAVIGVLAASSVYVTERNDATMRAIGPAAAAQHR